MKKKKSIIYFGKETESAIREYIKYKEDPETRELLYLNKICPAFEKLTENIINYKKFNFHKLGKFTSLQNEVVTHLYSQLDKFNPRKLSKNNHKRVKAFSYFGTIAKNYLVQLSQKRSKTNYIHENFDGTEANTQLDESLISPDNIEEKLEMNEFFELLAKHFENHRNEYCLNKQKIGDAIVFFLKNVQKEQLWNKRHWYIILREWSGLSAKEITMYLKELKEEYQQVRKSYYEDYV